MYIVYLIYHTITLDRLQYGICTRKQTNLGDLLCCDTLFIVEVWNEPVVSQVLECARMVHALEEEMATHSSVLAWRIPGLGEPGGLPSMGSHRVRHD